jgi:hypothetical protein
VRGESLDFDEAQYLPDEWLVELGRITQAWANFEQLLNLMLGKLAGFDGAFGTIPSILITHSSFPQRLDMFAALCEARLPEHSNLATYKEVLALARRAQARRNKFMHNQIGVADCEPGFGKIGIVSARGKLKQNLEEISLSELKEASQMIVDAGRSMFLLVLRNPD